MFISVHICTADGEWKRLCRTPYTEKRMAAHQPVPSPPTLLVAMLLPCHATIAPGAEQTYRLMSQLHERRVVQLPNLILGPVVAGSTSIDSPPDSPLSFWRRGRSGRNGCEGVIHGRTECSRASYCSSNSSSNTTATTTTTRGPQAPRRRPLREQSQRHGYGCDDESRRI